MGRKIVRSVLVLLALNAVAYAIGRLISRQHSSGDEISADFTRVALWGGSEFVSRAPALRSGAVRIRGGGMLVDLREAGLDPEGAHLDVDVKGGGALVLVPEEWRITVEADTSLGGIEMALPDEAGLPAEAPHLHVCARSVAGGVSITTKRDRAP